MAEYKKCPKCGGWIPKNWSYHEKRSWNPPETRDTERDEIIRDMEKAVVDSFEIWKKLKQKYQVGCSQLDLTKIALTLFIQKRRDKTALV